MRKEVKAGLPDRKSKEEEFRLKGKKKRHQGDTRDQPARY